MTHHASQPQTWRTVVSTAEAPAPWRAVALDRLQPCSLWRRHLASVAAGSQDGCHHCLQPNVGAARRAANSPGSAATPWRTVALDRLPEMWEPAAGRRLSVGWPHASRVRASGIAACEPHATTSQTPIPRLPASSANGAAPYQPGATPQVPGPHLPEGLKARSISSLQVTP